MPAERQWAADHCQSGTELRARCASESECECGSDVSEGVRLTTRREVDVCVCVQELLMLGTCLPYGDKNQINAFEINLV